MYKKNEPSSEKSGPIQTEDVLGRRIRLATGHAYAIKDINTKANGERIFVIVDPADSSKEIALNEKNFMNTFNAIDAIDLKNNSSKPEYCYR